jgi:flagellar biosynthetic protein FliS
MKSNNYISAYQNTIDSSLEHEVLSSSPSGLTYLLFRELTNQLNLLKRSIERNNLILEIKHSKQSIDIVYELQQSLDHSQFPEFVINMNFLYEYILKEITLVRIDRSVSRIDICKELIYPIQEAWEIISHSNNNL